MAKIFVMSRTAILFSIFVLINYNALTQDDFVFVKGGKFKMGIKDIKNQKPKHSIFVNDFYVLDHEVTNAEFVKFLNANGNQVENEALWFKPFWQWRNLSCPIYQKDSVWYVKANFENFPISNVNWFGAMAYCRWVGGTLPTEAEWEYIAQLSANTVNLDSISILKYAVFKTDSAYSPQPVKSKLPILGIYDLFGNMDEWCYDWYDGNYYKHSNKKNPTGPLIGRQKVKRGQNWSVNSRFFSIYTRNASHPNNNNLTIGFRVIKHIN